MQVSFFKGNREKLSKIIGKKPIVLSAYSTTQRMGDAAHSFEQESNFWYLTGISAPNWKIVIEGKKSWLIAPEIDEVHQIFDGSLSFSDAKRLSGVDGVYSQVEGKELLTNLARKYDVVATLGPDPRAKHYDFALNPGPVSHLRQLKRQFKEVKDCRHELAVLRSIKQPEEIVAIKAAIKLTTQAFRKVKKRFDMFNHEFEVESVFSIYFRSYGAAGHAYDPIVAGGKNACTLHYVKNSDPLYSGELLLLDIGVRLNGYAADITRTFAIDAVSPRHKAVHKAVQNAHKQIIELLKPDLKVVEYSEKVDVIMKEALESLGLLKEKGDYRKYFPHAVSHGLGIDVHDSLGGPDVFQPGMILTVEPGIYISEEGIGVRIEDDILITKTGHENLSKALSTSL